jgi:hypothetical protein
MGLRPKKKGVTGTGGGGNPIDDGTALCLIQHFYPSTNIMEMTIGEFKLKIDRIIDIAEMYGMTQIKETSRKQLDYIRRFEV